MGKKRRKSKPVDAVAVAARRGYAQAFGEAIPDMLALGACLLAWANPSAVRFDVIAVAAPLFFVQTALATPQTFSGVLRLREHDMSRRQKAGFLLWPVVVLLPLVWGLLGHWALLSLVLVCGEALWRALSGRMDNSAPVRGAWITYTEGEEGIGSSNSMMSMSVNSSLRRGRGFKQWRVEAGHTQVMATLTIGGAFVTMLVLLFTDVGVGGIDAAQLAASAWPNTLIGKIIPAHYALAAGVALFGLRTFAQFEDVIGKPEPPPPKIEDDPVLREIIEKVERESSKR